MLCIICRTSCIIAIIIRLASWKCAHCNSLDQRQRQTTPRDRCMHQQPMGLQIFRSGQSASKPERLDDTSLTVPIDDDHTATSWARSISLRFVVFRYAMWIYEELLFHGLISNMYLTRECRQHVVWFCFHRVVVMILSKRGGQLTSLLQCMLATCLAPRLSN